MLELIFKVFKDIGWREEKNIEKHTKKNQLRSIVNQLVFPLTEIQLVIWFNEIIHDSIC